MGSSVVGRDSEVKDWTGRETEGSTTTGGTKAWSWTVVESKETGRERAGTGGRSGRSGWTGDEEKEEEEEEEAVLTVSCLGSQHSVEG